MTTAVLEYPEGRLSLSRPGGDPSLRAWDAADELLLEEVFRRVDAGTEPKVLVVDDQFGALALGLHRYQPDLLADSATLLEALAHNARMNPGVSAKATVMSWLEPPETSYDAVVLRIPRHADYLAWLLRWVNGVLKDDGLLFAGGMIKHLPDRSVEVFAQAVETEIVCPARKKARVVVCRRGAAGLDPWPGTWKGYGPDDLGFTVAALPAVFARERLDIGTRLLLPHVKATVSGLVSNARVLDLACGNGVVGLSALAVRPKMAVTFTDVSSQAVLSARRNVSAAFPDSPASFEHADGIAGSAGLFDLILLNPPFHEGGVVGDHVALRLFAQAAKHLSPGGRLLMVGNRHLGYHRSLRRFFPQVRQLDASPKFVVLEAGLQ
ncbi:class I SAM-dependent methyltransferase [Marinobacter sp. F4218]|uniref:class I SAM-dependent methyltransferase n=1 Tax=Marinobacter sp. F4218 TaxID=2862868 RepID=UPI001C6292E2|nr:class I SAM-dependent methyltransferase [Marinobacter sp. F4218]MBW7470318.1 class I SAM-dependent methyltransferase [Marinobacter sp. F4218]